MNTGRTHLALVVGALVTAVLIGQAFAQAPSIAFRAKGQFGCTDNGSASVPLSFARVEIWRSGSVTNDFMAAGGTDAQGRFDIAVWSNDPWVFANLQNMNLHAVVVLDDDYPSSIAPLDTRQRTVGHPVKQINENHSSISSKVSAAGSIQNGIKDFGSWTIGTDFNPSGSDNSSHCGVWLLSRDAYVDYIDKVGVFPPVNQYDILSIGFTGTPWTALETTNWPHYYPTTGTVNAHEFGHAIRHSFDGDGAHFFRDALVFRYARSHSLCNSEHLGTEGDDTRKGYAFNEGWAEYWEGAIWGCAGQPNVIPGDTTVEGEVAKKLYGLANCAGVDQPGKKGMVLVLQKNPGSIHSYSEFEQHFYVDFPGCIGVHRAGIDVSRQVSLGASEVLRSRMRSEFRTSPVVDRRRQERLATNASNAAALAAQVVAAKASAKSVRPCTGASCGESVKVVLKPAFIDAVAKLHDLEAHRLQDLSNHEEETQKRVLDGTYTASSAAGAAAYNRARGQIALVALRNALADLEVYQKASPEPEVASSVSELRHELSELERSLEQGRVPSIAIEDVDLFADDEKIERAR